MLAHLRIQDFALIEELELDLEVAERYVSLGLFDVNGGLDEEGVEFTLNFFTEAGVVEETAAGGEGEVVHTRCPMAIRGSTQGAALGILGAGGDVCCNNAIQRSS